MLDINKLLECAGNNIAETLKMVDPAQIDAIEIHVVTQKQP